MLAFHGTTADNLADILENGLKCDKEKLWSVSEDAVYCWSKNYLREGEIEEEFAYDQLKEKALSHATIGLAKAKDCRAVVVVFNVDEEELETDYSCPNMESANCVNRNIKPEEFQAVWVSQDLSLLRGAFIATMLYRPLSNMEFSQLEIKVGKAFYNAGLGYYEALEIAELENVLTPSFSGV